MRTRTPGPRRVLRTPRAKRDPVAEDSGRRRALRLPSPDRRREVAQGFLNIASLIGRAPWKGARETAAALIETGRYWRAERSTLRQGFGSLGISSIGDLIAGLALGAMEHRLEMLPGLIILIPAAIGMRGNIFGALGSRLGTSIHSGLLEFNLSRRGMLFQNSYSATLLSILTSGILAVLAKLMSLATGLPSVSILDYLAISVIAGVFSGMIILVFTIGLARTAYRRSWDMDAVASPLITFMGDVITLPSLFAASYVVGHGVVTELAAVVVGAGVVAAAVGAIRTRLPIARRILRESIAVLTFAAVLDLIAGAMVEHRLDSFLALPALLVVLPPFLAEAGALGGIVSARLASKLHLGAIRPSLFPQRQAFLEISLLVPFALSVFTLVGISAHVVTLALGKESPGLLAMVLLCLSAGAIATVGAAFVAYTAGVMTFRFGLDPDNHGIPIVTSTLDLVGVVALVAMIFALGIG